MQNFLAIQEIPLFPDFWTVLTHFWPFCCCTEAWGGRAYLGGQAKRLRKNLEKSKQWKNQFFLKGAGFPRDSGKNTFFWISGPFWPIFGHLTEKHRKTDETRSIETISKGASSAYPGSWLGLGSLGWYPCRVPTSVYIEIIGRGWDAGHPPPPTFFF